MVAGLVSGALVPAFMVRLVNQYIVYSARKRWLAVAAYALKDLGRVTRAGGLSERYDHYKMIKTIVCLASLAVLAFEVPAHGRLTFVCPGGFVPSGPEKGAPMGINAKQNMTCRQVRRAIARGS
jgi:hypothetical protein